MGKKLTHEQVSAALAEEGYVLLSTFQKSGDKNTVRCPSLHEYQVTWEHWKAGRRCPSCYEEESRVTLEEVQTLLQENGYSLNGEFKNAHGPLPIVCPVGHSTTSSYKVFRKGGRCSTCRCEANKVPMEVVLKEVLDEGYKLKSPYVKLEDPIIMECPQGHTWETRGQNIYYHHNRCAKCSWESLKLSPDVFSEALTKEGYQLLSKYINTGTKVSVKCPNQHDWEVRPGHFMYLDYRCSFCKPPESKAQLDLYEYVKTLGVEAKLSDRTTIKNPKTNYPLEIDVLVPGKLAIEYNGLYWHSSASPNFKRNAEALKSELVRKAGLKYLMVYEDEWTNEAKQNLIKAMIRMRLGKFDGIKLNARKLEVRRLDKNSQFQAFFERNHIDGHRTASFAYGLFHNDALVACASFGKSFNGETECVRFATDYDYHVRGAAGKILGQVKGPLVSYSNNRLSDGGVYRLLGFKEVTKCKSPSYYYTDGTVRVWRYRAKRINTPEILARYPDVPHTEVGQALGGVFSMEVLGFGDRRPLYRIEDCGHRKWLRE